MDVVPWAWAGDALGTVLVQLCGCRTRSRFRAQGSPWEPLCCCPWPLGQAQALTAATHNQRDGG